MLTFCVLHPGTFSLEQFADPHYGRFARSFLRNLFSNSLLLIDHQGCLLDELELKISQLPIKHRQELEIHLESLRISLRSKKSRQVIVKCSPERCPISKNQSSDRKCGVLSKNTSVDAVVCGAGDLRSLQAEIPAGLLIELPDYDDSSVESTRRSWLDGLPPVDQMGDGQFDELIIRVTRYSTWLRFYDKQIGKGTNPSNFRRGIERILQLWVRNCHFVPQTVEIITTESDSEVARDGEFENQRRRERSRQAIATVKERIVTPLERTYSLRFSLSVKQDGSNTFHARHLQSQTSNILFERGFDFINEDGSFRRAFIQMANGAQSHLQEYRLSSESVQV